MTDGAIMLGVGAAAATAALVARWADQRRLRRTDPDAVGFMPWTTIYFIALVVACVSLGSSARGWLAG